MIRQCISMILIALVLTGCSLKVSSRPTVDETPDDEVTIETRCKDGLAYFVAREGYEGDRVVAVGRVMELDSECLN